MLEPVVCHLVALLPSFRWVLQHCKGVTASSLAGLLDELGGVE